ncbi:MAG TPA: Ig-like domain-containing protein [Spirochaetota bacterium]|nr:Ig-like domain-containing protein [Spirochaetota bacterium]
MAELLCKASCKYLAVIVTVSLIAFAGCGTNWFGGSTDIVSTLELYPHTTKIAPGYPLDLRATAVLGDRSRKDVTADAQWETTNPSVIKVTENGVIRGIAPGAAVIRAHYEGYTQSIGIIVTDARLRSIQVTPLHPVLAPGAQRRFSATGIFSDGSMMDLTSRANWSSSDPYTATVTSGEDAGGLVEVGNPGMTRISASVAGITGGTMVNASSARLESIQVTPINPSGAIGTTIRFSATGIYDNKTTIDLTRQVAWTSSSASVAKFAHGTDSSGHAELVSGGETAIAASFDGVLGQTMLKVAQADIVAIQVTPANVSKPAGLWVQFVATGIFSDGSHQDITADVTWSVENQNAQVPVASVSNQQGHEGKATALTPGAVTVRAIRVRDGFMNDSVVEGSTRFTVR